MDEAQIKAMIAAAFKDFQTAVLPGVMTAAFSPLQEQMKGIADGLTALKPAAAAAAPPAAAAAAAAAPAAAQPGAGLTPEVNAMILEAKRNNEALAAQVKALTDKNVETEKKADIAERQAVINTALNGFQFASDSARATAIGLIEAQVKRNEQGQLVAGENLTPDGFVKDFLPTQHPYLLAPTNAGGSGASFTGGSAHQGKAATMEMIQPNMKPEDRAAIVQSIQAAAANIGR